MKEVTCEICNKIFKPTKDNKLVGLVGTNGSWACDDCLTAESDKVEFVDDRGIANSALRCE